MGLNCDGASFNVGGLTSSTVSGVATWTGSWDSTACLNGAASIYAVYGWTDTFGAWHTWYSPSISFTVTNPVAWRAQEMYQHSFSPNGDGQEDTWTGSWSTNRDATWTTTVRPAAGGAVVRTVESAVSDSWSHYVSWDGLNDAGNPVANGAYAVTVSATAGGSTVTSSIETTVDKRLPGAITSPAADSTASRVPSPAGS